MENINSEIISYGKIIPIRSLKDNYIWCIVKNNKIIVIDPGDYNRVINFINKFSLKLEAILVTHKHKDHTAGIEKLKIEFDVPVYASKNTNISFCSNPVEENDIIRIQDLGITLKVIDVPGHTNDHIAFYGENFNNLRILFCGDVLFSGGCGRIFEGEYIEMFNSLKKLQSLPLNTLVFCSHEYTIKNLIWAMKVDKNNLNIKYWYKHAQLLRKFSYPTLPSSIVKENYINPFLRTNYIDVIKSASIYARNHLKSSLEVFIELRKWKNES